MNDRAGGTANFDYMQINDLLYGNMMAGIKYNKIKHEKLAL